MRAEDYYEAALLVVIQAQYASASFLQRQLNVSRNTANVVLEMLVADGIISEPDPSGARTIYVKPRTA